MADAMDYESEVDEGIQPIPALDLDEEDAEAIPRVEDEAVVVVLEERPVDRTEDGSAKKNINFARQSNLCYTMIEKDEIGKVVAECKKEYDAKVMELKGKSRRYSQRLKLHVNVMPKEGYPAKGCPYLLQRFKCDEI